MQIFVGENSTQECLLDPSSNEGKPPLLMDEYMHMATEKLQAIAELVNRGESVDQESHDWMLAQVDFLTDVFGNENLEFDDQLRSSVLQLVLAIANLNEQIRHQSSPNL
jgi:hypothetical protein